ncbi:porin [Marinobacterium jannaschii]|uniref:porin n=1 Tax=Marinobacterium jannaschii TaxID=64970 RepID=UPI0004850AF3|nr:porin [Marinobacterium jannaschii]
MKKSLIALAVAGALTAPMVAQADATLYGSVRLKVVSADDKTLDVADNSSRVGIKGSTELFSGAKGIFQGEWKVGNNDDAGFGDGRLWYAGATGDFGTATIGQQWTPHYNWTGGATDIGDNGATGGTQKYFRLGNTVAYITPNMSGFQAAAVAVLDGGDDSDPTQEDVAGYNVAATYSMGGLGFGLSTVQLEEATGAAVDSTSAVAVSYSADALYVAARYETNDSVDGSADSDTYEVVGSYAMGNTKLIGQYLDFDNEGSLTALEVQQKLGKKARVFAAYTLADSDAETAGKADTLEVGYRVDF